MKRQQGMATFKNMLSNRRLLSKRYNPERKTPKNSILQNGERKTSTCVATLNVKTTLNVKIVYTKGKFLH